MTRETPANKGSGLLALLLDVFDVPVVVRVGTTLVKIGWINLHEGRAVLELDPEDMEVAVEDLVLDSVTAARSIAATREAAPGGT
ncbi:hypothetical protein FHR83_007490 [Actinoplanes campanulatus]|uniref:Uncharacterized protein n=1 Tax=Actinoplanes campanulatus TaxID=113559 RepID=A0A7W5FIL4_9ACTN|nr:hypothetical protein [Actinoplanes campanulatus]MBB3099774.1 hypothetical protein [Actinoplanes campanulatus]GGN47066.1 hypothetical protein GCM10010109_82920 [Actinoplanes campanulatus]GID42353.1 hypothetical protein Aca09nite_88590 [Actinoplanes campanulatus]